MFSRVLFFGFLDAGWISFSDTAAGVVASGVAADDGLGEGDGVEDDDGSPSRRFRPLGSGRLRAEARDAKMHWACNPHYLSRWHNIFHSRQVISINLHAGAQDLS